jgi:amidase
MPSTASTHSPRTPITADDNLAFAGIVRLGELLSGGHVTPRELAEFYLRRIEQLDPLLGAFVSLRAARALAEADAAFERLRGGERGPLLGMPVALKDNVDIAGETTTHGSSVGREPAGSDSEVVRRLRAAGAVVLGKTALPELAAWGHFTASEAFGVTRNPWMTDRSPGGSSGGSAVAVAAGLVPIALGSDGGGSIRIPAALCGLFGLKPQRGRVSLAPLSDHWHGCTVLGGLGRSVIDVALFNDVISGVIVAPGASTRPPGSLAAAAERSPGRLRVAVSRKAPIPGVKPSAVAVDALEDASQLLRSLGHEVHDHELSHPRLLSRYTPRWAAGISDDAGCEARGLERRTRQLARVGRLLGGRALRRSIGSEDALARRLNAVFDRYDLVVTPTTAAPPPPAEISRGAGALRTFNAGSPYVCYTPTWNYVGQPAASVPTGFDGEGLPTAVQFAGPLGAEATLVALAAQIETARPWTAHRPHILDASGQSPATPPGATFTQHQPRRTR